MDASDSFEADPKTDSENTEQSEQSEQSIRTVGPLCGGTCLSIAGRTVVHEKGTGNQRAIDAAH